MMFSIHFLEWKVSHFISNLTEVYSQSVRILFRVISLQILMMWINKICLKIADLKSQLHIPGTNELTSLMVTTIFFVTAHYWFRYVCKSHRDGKKSIFVGRYKTVQCLDSQEAAQAWLDIELYWFISWQEYLISGEVCLKANTCHCDAVYFTTICLFLDGCNVWSN